MDAFIFHNIYICLILAICIVLLIYILINKIKEKKANDNCEVISIEAKCIKINTKIAFLSTQRISKYFITFKLANKQTLTFTIVPMLGEVIKENSKGILTYQGTRFISFEKK